LVPIPLLIDYSPICLVLQVECPLSCRRSPQLMRPRVLSKLPNRPLESWNLGYESGESLPFPSSNVCWSLVFRTRKLTDPLPSSPFYMAALSTRSLSVSLCEMIVFSFAPPARPPLFPHSQPLSHAQLEAVRLVTMEPRTLFPKSFDGSFFPLFLSSAIFNSSLPPSLARGQLQASSCPCGPLESDMPMPF